MYVVHKSNSDEKVRLFLVIYNNLDEFLFPVNFLFQKYKNIFESTIFPND